MQHFKKKIPQYCLANNVDFGNYRRIGLTKPNIIESHILSRLRLYQTLIKIKNNQKNGTHANYTGWKIQGNAILFPHTTPIVAPLGLILTNTLDQPSLPNPLLDLIKTSIQFQFLGSNSETDFLMKETFQTSILKARSYVIYQWYVCLHEINFLFTTDPQLPPFNNFTSLINEINLTLLDGHRPGVLYMGVVCGMCQHKRGTMVM